MLYTFNLPVVLLNCLGLAGLLSYAIQLPAQTRYPRQVTKPVIGLHLERETMNTVIEKDAIEAVLAGFSGTENYHKLTFRSDFFCTDGVEYLASVAQAFWLIDAVASHVFYTAKREPFQVWKLTVENKKAVLVCTDGDKGDGEKELVRQEISYTDFPLSEIRFYVESASLDGERTCWVMMLPQER
jgi:hypothetical protein